MSQELLESIQAVSVIEPVDLTSGANSGDWISLAKYRRVLFLIAKGAGGTAGQDPVITLQEATDASGTGAQNLAAIDKVFSKQAATDLTAVAAFTVVTQTAAATYTDADLAEQAALIGIEVKADELSSGFDFCTINIADPGAGNSQIGAVLALCLEPRYGGQVGVSAIA